MGRYTDIDYWDLKELRTSVWDLKFRAEVYNISVISNDDYINLELVPKSDYDNLINEYDDIVNLYNSLLADLKDDTNWRHSSAMQRIRNNQFK